MVGSVMLMVATTGWGTVRYVDAAATGGNNGSDWANAYTNLEAALAAATINVDEIWVARGTYSPTNETSRDSTFTLKTGVAVYGGFAGGETERSQRNWTNNVTLLSGDIGVRGNNSDNTYHVINGANNATLDSVWVTGGKADGSGVKYHGGGLYISGVAMTVENCIFSNNASLYYGPAIDVYGGSSATIRNCLFVTNRVEGVGSPSGGAVFMGGVSITILDSSFVDNSSAQYAADLFLMSFSGSATVSNCVFKRGVAAGDGGAIKVSAGAPLITACTFIGSSSAGYGGAIALAGGGTVERCVFVDNKGNNGGAAYVGGAATFRNCVMSGNQQKISSTGGGLYLAGAALVERCLIAGNKSDYAAGIRVNGASPTIRNCVIAGNSSLYYGGAIGIQAAGSAPRFVNCTVIENESSNGADGKGGGLFLLNGISSVTNCIFWGNVAKNNGREFYISAGTTTTVSYCDIKGGWNGSGVYNGGTMVDGGGNTNADPLFARADEGAWEAVGSYDTDSGRMTLADDQANWPEGALAGCIVNPDTNQWRQFVIVTNTATTVTILGNASSFATAGDPFRVRDIHEQSKVGHWTPLGWVTDASQSPCIDTGDTNTSYALEPNPNGGRINMGAFGGTEFASKSPLNKPTGAMVTIH
jgi:hypothetical protein